MTFSARGNLFSKEMDNLPNAKTEPPHGLTVQIPRSKNIVNLSIINTTSSITVPTYPFVTPAIEGHDAWTVPSYSFLIRNEAQKRTVLFDLGVRKNHENLAPALAEKLKSQNFRIKVEKGVREILDDHGVDTSGEYIEAIIWSHGHFDHTGDPSTFDQGTSLVVGPEFKERMMPGYPTNPDSPVLDSDWAGREVRQIQFTSQLQIGRFKAFDYSNDGSFYLLDAPGHAVGHMCGLARVTNEPQTFVFLGGDAAHDGGEFRPSQWMPFPSELPSFGNKSLTFCPGELCAKLVPGADDTTPMYRPASNGAHLNVTRTEETISKMQEVDALQQVLVVLAHDSSLLDVVDFFPKTAARFGDHGWKDKARWAFLKEFEPELRAN